jgi:hypothetical protein
MVKIWVRRREKGDIEDAQDAANINSKKYVEQYIHFRFTNKVSSETASPEMSTQRKEISNWYEKIPNSISISI